MWWWLWWWWWWRSKAIEMWFHGLPNLYKRSTFCLFLSLHSAPEDLTWVGSVPFAKNRLVERIACKGTRCLNTTMLVSPHFKEFRCLHRNVSGHYLLLFKNPRGKLQNLTLGKQMYPGQTYFFLNQYEEAVKRPFGYLLIDLKTTAQDNCPLRKNLLPSEEGFNQVGYQENIP